MRVIAGTHRSRRLLPPEGDEVTRPITDRVKQAMFDRLWSLGALDTAHALDLFAGTGSLGIEALSRGVERVTFIERDRDARARLDKNLTTLQLHDRATVLHVDAFGSTYLSLLHRAAAGLIFCDPPYAVAADAPDRVTRLIVQLAAVAAPAATLVLRTDGHTAAAACDGWHGPDTHGYGSMALHFYTRSEPA
jgi:16S rRNA (guanine966-N2)-methyltransferase